MKTLLKVLLSLLKWILIIGLILFSIATFMGRSYLQTLLLWIAIAAMAYWPSSLFRSWTKRVSLIVRISTVILLLVSGFVFFQPDAKTSIYLTPDYRIELMAIYDERVQLWPEGTEDIFINTGFGNVHVLACGSTGNPPLVMIHAASMGAHSWAENLDPLVDHYRIYSIDNIGEGNKSELTDVLDYPKTQEEIARHMATILDSLGVKRSPLFGASNGGFIALSYASFYPERVESLALFGPMGLTRLTGKSIMMLSLATMYPFQFIRDWVTRWALGEDEYVIGTYGKWFNCILKGTIPSVAMPVPVASDQKAGMDMPILLFLGSRDPVVGKPEMAKRMAEEYPDIQIEVMESGHLVATECAAAVNQKVLEFLKLPS